VEISKKASGILRRKVVATKTKERDNNQLPMMLSKALNYPYEEKVLSCT